MTDSRSVIHPDRLDALGERAATETRLIADGIVGDLQDARRLVDRGRRRRAARLATIVSAAALVLVGAGLLQARARSDSEVIGVAATDIGSQGETTDPPAPTTVEQGLGPIAASGWLAYSGDDVLHPEPGGVAGTKGYLRSGENVAPGKATVYDAPNGAVVGYAYAQLGFVSITEDATFDAHAERVERFGCDAFQDVNCHTEGLDVSGP